MEWLLVPLLVLGWMQPGQRTFGEKNPLDDPVEFVEAGFGCFKMVAVGFVCLIVMVILLALAVVGLLGWVIVK